MKKIITDSKAVEEVLSRGVVDCIEVEQLREQLLSGKQLRIKFGIDPTSPHIHLGHTVPLRKLRQFQDLGHKAVLIIGDATAMIGDPTGRSEARKQLSREEIDENKKTYVKQAGKILDLDTVEIRHNGEWFDDMPMAEFLGLTSLVTVQQILQREDFRQRLDNSEHPLTAIEIAYPVMQGYDSVMVKSDVEIGGQDQLLNVLMGRRLQRKFDISEQNVLTTPLLEGTDGERKMSKSFGNSIPVESEPEDMFGKVMSIPDTHIVPYFTLLTGLSMDEIGGIEGRLTGGENPRDIKMELAKEIVNTFHDAESAERAQNHFLRVFSQHEIPEEMPEHALTAPMSIIDVLVETGLTSSKSDARRMLGQSAVKIDGETVKDIEHILTPGQEIVLQRGKRHFVRVK